MLDQNEGNPVKKFCPHHLVDSDVKANVTCAVYNYNGSGKSYATLTETRAIDGSHRWDVLQFCA